MKCKACGRDFSVLRKYIFHIEYAHNINNYYKCPLDYCGRLYNRRDNFKRHMTSKHNDHFNTKHCFRENAEIFPGKRQHEIHKICELSDGFVSSSNSEFDCKQELNTFNSLLLSNISILVAKLYDNTDLNRSAIQFLIECIQSFLKSGILNSIRKLCNHLTNDLDNSKQILTFINDMFSSLENCFDPLNTEYKRFRYFERSKHFFGPTEHAIGVSEDQKLVNKEKILALKTRYAYFISMRHTLKLFLEIPGVFQGIVNYQTNLEHSYETSKCMTNVIHGSLWNNLKKLFPGDQIVFPIVVYFDDFESLNPLGSHAGLYKIGSVYYSIPTIPPEYYSRLQNIFLSLIFYSGDRVHFGNQVTFDVLIRELKFLEKTGVDITTEHGGLVNIKFHMIALIGDNLGIHSIMGLNESFSSIYYCRFCTASKTYMNTQTIQSSELMRKKTCYEEDLADLIGIKERCIWNELPNFHIYDNFSCDVMHDLFEGILRYDMAFIIKELINEGHFTLEQLNARIKYFKYETSEKNICPGIKKEQISDNSCLIMSAAEMKCLASNFCFIVGDLVPEDNEIWKFYLIMLELIDLLISCSFTEATLDLLTSIIQQHNELYVELSKQNLKPKFHFLVHYPHIISKIGPPIHLSCMRFEAKHREFKNASQKTNCRKNLPLTLAIRSQLKFCYRLCAIEGFNDKIRIGKIYDICDSDIITILKLNSLDPDHYAYTTFYNKNGINYDIDSVLLYKIIDDVPKFCKINKILINKSNSSDIYLYCSLLNCIAYSDHLYAYKVLETMEYDLLSLASLSSPFATIAHKIQNYIYVTKFCT